MLIVVAHLARVLQGCVASSWISPPPSTRALADTRQIGKLSREQFALAMHLIQQKVGKGIDPPQSLTPDMIPPSERSTPVPVGFLHSDRTRAAHPAIWLFTRTKTAVQV